MDATTPADPPVTLSLVERRVLGVLIEKQKTTPDVYPMSLNGLTVGCNQKSNRDPVLNLTDEVIEETLESLNRRQLVIRVLSGRVDKWKHVLYEQWGVEKAGLAVLAELFLRGPQTEGELRTRVNRMEPVEDIDALRGIVHKLRDQGFATYLTPEGRRGTVVGTTLLPPGELSSLQHKFESGVSVDEIEPPRGISARSGSAPDDDLRKELAELRLTVASLAEQVRELQNQLGIAPPG
ncbi:MAG: YceH family protein [Gemmataceae bacterium]|nr:YceH family protein [Gemmataceae bacterium]